MYWFIGIKGTGMAALATMLHDLGNEVAGSDLEKHFFTEDELVKRGIQIYPFCKDNIKDGYTVIIGNAFLEDFEEVQAARSNPTCTCYRYHEFLGKLIENYRSVAICGSHGKTTTTTMAKTVFEAFTKTGYLIGDGEGYLDPESEVFCFEADEFRRHFAKYYPDYAIINNIEIDHVDYFKDEDDYFNAYQEFAGNVKEGIFYNGDDPWCRKLTFDVPAFSFGFGEDNDFSIANLEEDSDGSSFDLLFRGNSFFRYHLKFVGTHLIYDALGVISLATMMGYDPNRIEAALNRFIGPKRRYVIEEYKDSVFVDDYAHHPTEVKVTLEATRKRYPDREIIAVFKPHRASRVKYFVQDFADALKIADKVYLLDFTSIDDKQDGTDIDIHYLADILPGSVVLSEDEEGAKELAKHHGAVYLFMSSKDIYNIAEWTKEHI
ncbi:MAG: UDP-N-acetylmuramate--alanine ligase [Erysipelotrichaceae bacterium]|nr:UDP-N-acetylmuramate--alanine ligase [Erysipelotrichaceae bacterium]